MTDITNNQDTLDVRDIIARVEALEDERDNLPEDKTDVAAWQELEGEELKTLTALLDELKGGGGDEQWRGDWYPISLIRDDYFETAMDELLEDCGELAAFDKRPSYIKITIDYDALQSDYTSVEYDGVAYWYR